MKKSILVLTDQSDKSKHAAEAALMLAGHLDLNLVLLNCNDTISAVTYYPIMPVMSESATWYEDRKERLTLMVADLKLLFVKAFPGKAQPVIKVIIKEGDLFENIKDELKHHQTELIVMGSQSGTSTDHFLFGSDTLNVTAKAPVPVLTVPPTADLKSIARITFATDFVEHDTYTLYHLLRLRQKLDAKLEILHIRQYGHAPVQKSPLVKRIIEEACTAKPSAISYKEIYGKQIASRLKNYCLENKSDLLALSHKHHSFLFKAFKEGTVEKSLSDQLTPLLIIPELKGEKIHKSTFKDLANVVF